MKKKLSHFSGPKNKMGKFFLTIDFYENLHEHFFVQNQFLNIKKNKRNKNIEYKTFISN